MSQIDLGKAVGHNEGDVPVRESATRQFVLVRLLTVARFTSHLNLVLQISCIGCLEPA